MPHDSAGGHSTPAGALFRRLPGGGPPVTIQLDGKPVTAAAGDSVAAALLAAGVLVFRTSAVGGTPRAPYCLIGNCFECLVEIDGVPNRQACLEPVAEGMHVRLQSGTGGVTAP